MSQIFHHSTNIWSKVSILGALVFIGTLATVVVVISWSGYVTGQGVVVDQPVQFSHAHHVGSMGIDCRYCHTTVEESAFANIPPTKTVSSSLDSAIAWRTGSESAAAAPRSPSAVSRSSLSPNTSDWAFQQPPIRSMPPDTSRR